MSDKIEVYEDNEGKKFIWKNESSYDLESYEEGRQELKVTLEELSKFRFSLKNNDVIHWMHIREIINDLQRRR